MKRWALVVVLLYALIFLVLTLPVTIVSPYDIWTVENIKEMPKGIFTSWQFWIGMVLVLLTQIALLVIPVRKAEGRPITKRTVIAPIVASAFLIGLLAGGLFLAVTETIRGESFPEEEIWLWLAGVIFITIWVVWAIIFYRWSKKLEPLNLVEKMCRLFFRGSILELLVAVPTHIVARYKNYCCAGFGTFFGITFGLAIMLLSFGPGVFFLYKERWQKLRGRPPLSGPIENK
jgi:RsiW-degrading membrane proteinase PrsW (M82 family)